VELFLVSILAPRLAVDSVRVLDATATSLPGTTLGGVVERTVELTIIRAAVKLDATAGFTACSLTPAPLDTPHTSFHELAGHRVKIVSSAPLTIFRVWDQIALEWTFVVLLEVATIVTSNITIRVSALVTKLVLKLA